MFNARDYDGRVAVGELTRTVFREHEAPPSAGQPAGTLSQMVRYANRQQRTVAEAHRYLLPDGTIGASGLHDPKRLFLADVILVVDPSIHD